MYFNRNEKVFTRRRFRYVLASCVFFALTCMGMGILAARGILGSPFDTGVLWSVLHIFATLAIYIGLPSIGMLAIKILTLVMGWLFFTAVHALFSQISFEHDCSVQRKIPPSGRENILRRILSTTWWWDIVLYGSVQNAQNRVYKRDTPKNAALGFWIVICNPATLLVFFFEFLRTAIHACLEPIYFSNAPPSRSLLFARFFSIFCLRSYYFL